MPIKKYNDIKEVVSYAAQSLDLLELAQRKNQNQKAQIVLFEELNKNNQFEIELLTDARDKLIRSHYATEKRHQKELKKARRKTFWKSVGGVLIGVATGVLISG